MIPWRHISQWAAIAAVAVAVVGIALTVKGWHDNSEALPRVKLERDAARAMATQLRADLESEITRLQGVTEGLRNENATLQRNRADTPVRTVRLCREAPERTPVPSDPPAAVRDDAAATGTRPLPEEGPWDSGPDIGPDLYALFDEADDLLARYRALREYVEGLPKACSG